ncbi:MAG: hypothetical protein JJ891_06730 [Rhizobiaceae bacterium]|nr:hypothetical protein [Rhizobiaceae bacterium]
MRKTNYEKLRRIRMRLISETETVRRLRDKNQILERELYHLTGNNRRIFATHLYDSITRYCSGELAKTLAERVTRMESLINQAREESGNVILEFFIKPLRIGYMVNGNEMIPPIPTEHPSACKMVKQYDID